MKRIWLIPVFFLLLIPGAMAGLSCVPVGGSYPDTFYISCSYAPYDLGGTAANQSMRFYWMYGGRFGTVKKIVSNPTTLLPFYGGNATSFYPSPYNLTGEVVVMTYGDPGACVQPLNVSLVRDCSGAGNCCWGGYYDYGTYDFGNYTSPTVVADFIGSPVLGPVPLPVSFTDNSTGTEPTPTYNWSVSPAGGVAIDSPTSANTVMHFGTVGNYTITHGVSNGYQSDIETKTDYIYVYNSTATTTTYFYTYNALIGYEIRNSNIYLQDIENGSWVNSTNDLDGRLGITTLGGHHINAYGTATGFGDADILNQISDGGSYPLIMYSSNVTNVSAGSVTLFVSVVDTRSPGTPVSGATVNLAYDTPGGQFNDYSITNSGGLASFTVPNQTLIYVYAEKSGYTPGGSTVNSGTGSGGSASVSTIVYITQTEVTPTVTATTGPGGTVPVTVDPYPCIGDGSYQDNINCQRKQTEMGADVIAWAPTLIQLFILATIIGTLKIMTK